MTDLDLSRFEVLTFDCYGTLIDWEAGILAAARTVLGAHDRDVADDDLLERYAHHEAALEAGPYQGYRAVLAESIRRLATEMGVVPTAAELASFVDSLPRWPAFADASAALQRLGQRYRLGVISNCDDDPFAASALRLESAFAWIVTAQQAGAYKPDLAPFQRALAMIGLPANRILHVAQSLYHDHVPAKRLGLATVWVNRRHGRPGFGATPEAEASPDLVVPDLNTLADLAAQ